MRVFFYAECMENVKIGEDDCACLRERSHATMVLARFKRPRSINGRRT